jgi:hypothetical protein
MHCIGRILSNVTPTIRCSFASQNVDGASPNSGDTLPQAAPGVDEECVLNCENQMPDMVTV